LKNKQLLKATQTFVNCQISIKTPFYLINGAQIAKSPEKE